MPAKIIFITWLAVLCIGSFLQAQPIHRTCGTTHLHELQMSDSSYATYYAQKINLKKEWLKNHRRVAKGNCPEILFIPVAVHFQDVTIDMACAIDMAVDQVRILNEDFSGTNADIANWTDGQAMTWPGIQNKESCIQFCLASKSHPAGFGLADNEYAVTLNQTNGGNLPAWSGYMNMFVRDMVNPLGFSPLGGDGDGDGVTVGIAYFGSINCGGNNLSGPYGLGRTATHEVGHYLSLRHPFDSGDCTTDGDGIADTPLTDNSIFGCYPVGEEIINCAAPALWPSYMDYCDDACLYMFSAGQVDDMDAYVATSLQNLMNSATIRCQDAACINYRVMVAAEDESCAGMDGRITLTASGGTMPYTYSINDNISTSTAPVFNAIAANDYTVVVIDDQGCEFRTKLKLNRASPTMDVLQVMPSFCGDNSGSLRVAVNYPDEFEFQIEGATPWQDTGYFGNLSFGEYAVTARTASGCRSAAFVSVGDNSDVNINLRRFQPINCPLSNNGLIEAIAPGGIPPLEWKLNDDQLQSDGIYEMLDPGLYEISVIDSRGCRDRYEFTIDISYSTIADDCPCQVFIPNAITANEDGLNDLLKPVPSCPISDYSFQVFNRWGSEIFQTNDQKKGWNGGEGAYYVGPDIFFYRVGYRWGEVGNESLERAIITGTVTVLR